MKCNEISNNILEKLKSDISKMVIKPAMNIIQVGDRSDSNSYIKNKIKHCELIGIQANLFKLEENISEEDLLEFVRLKAQTERIPCFVQLPLPKHIDENKVLSLINPERDIDGFTDMNIGKLVHGKDCMYPCTPKGIITILKYIKGNLSGNNVLIINRSNVVGKPLAMMLLQEDCTVTIAHSKTRDLKAKLKDYDIIIAAIGKADYFKAEDFNKGQVVIDVSMNINSEGKLCGDIAKKEYPKLEDKGVIFTEVPGGVGIMTVTSLLEQVVELYKKYNFMK